MKESVDFEIWGIYTRGKVPREDQLPEDYGLTHVTKDQIVCRRRLNTRPVQGHTDEQVDESGIEYEAARFVSEHGLVGTLFFHNDLEEHNSESSDSEEEEEEDNSNPPLCTEQRIYEERAILFQAVEHYEKLLDDPIMNRFFQEDDFEVIDKIPLVRLEKEDERRLDGKHPHYSQILDILKNPRFGEQLIVSGVDASQVCIGDIFEAEGGASTLTVEITSPRTVCAWIDKRVSSPFGLKGVKRYCNKRGLGGWFARVLVPGELRHGVKMVRTSCPHPKWNLAYISQSLYGEGPPSYMASSWAYWVGDKKELEELCNLKQLGRYEWKDEAEWILQHFDEYEKQWSNYKKGRLATISDIDHDHTMSLSSFGHNVLDKVHATPFFRRFFSIHRRASSLGCDGPASDAKEIPQN
mmetsp:Transcript_3440/g.6494  ORF Transcript_3440/g.6494 Transcript_3440/m.6494 type:complete len:410 (+) Transcript_3440:121-1350(+)|eukprot:CAMPEP_0176490858 /NCGR_PEP_ID=MMETSP0200_2-20121128/8108_1 /TAXON_ID=947934 /ORGANISM="Chaetoceros sp., Strain GSL56" /LENGTH=409 /DNA_ID=CAMNT_0017888219 /DNA_START=90 /DNA_END=1319 /DNA_ORIENTATION=+